MNTPEDVLKQYIAYINEQNYDAMYELLSNDTKNNTSDDSGTELVWFNAFRVSDDANEQVLVISMIENVKDRGGSHYLLSKVKNIFQ